MANKIIVHACGGTGIKVADKVINNVAILGDGFSDIDIKYIDTSRADISKIEHDPKAFWHIKSAEFGKDTLSGSGSERRHVSKEISGDIANYLNHYNLQNYHAGEYHLVVFSASGGSGGVIGSLIVKELLSENMPVVAIVVGDSSNGLSAINTLNTLAGLNNIANKAKKPLNIMYVNNKDFAENGILSGIDNANKAIFSSLSVLSLFLSGDNEALDNQDLSNIIDQSNYKTINIQPGLYALSTFSGKSTLPQGAIPTVARTLTIAGVSPDIGIQLLHHKSGIVTSENANKIFGKQYPLHLVSSANLFSVETMNLKTVTDEYYNMMHKIEVQHVEGTSESDESDDGLVF